MGEDRGGGRVSAYRFELHVTGKDGDEDVFIISANTIEEALTAAKKKLYSMREWAVAWGSVSLEVEE